MIRVGTSHFTSRVAAEHYYATYGFTPDDVARKLSDGEIAIGEPEYQPQAGQKLFIRKAEGRYFIGYPEANNV